MTRELPGNVPYAAKLSLLQMFRQTWDTAALACFRDVETDFKETVAGIIMDKLSRYSSLSSAVK